MTDDKWPLWVVERYYDYDQMGWCVVEDSMCPSKLRVEAEYKRTTGFGVRLIKEGAKPQDGDCRLRQCRIEVKP